MKIYLLKRNVMVNFEPGEYIRKMISQSLTEAAGNKKSQYLK